MSRGNIFDESVELVNEDEKRNVRVMLNNRSNPINVVISYDLARLENF